MEERNIVLDLEPEDEPTTEDAVFYNTEMVTNRDISVACLATYQQEQEDEITVCDALSASGIRGLRYLDEVVGVEQVILNDMNPAAVEQITANLTANKVPEEQATVVQQDANVTLSERFHALHMVDLDPFGSPAPYLDAAVRSLRHHAAIGVTATDLGPLYGSYPKVCRRRYGSLPLKNAFGHETGLRILLKEVFSTASRYNYAFEPLLCHYERHYHRIFGKVRESKKVCNRRMKYIGFLSWCRNCGWRGFDSLKDCRTTCPHCEETVERAGPLWTGPLGATQFAGQVAADLQDRGYDTAHTLAATVADECAIETPFYDTHELASQVGVQAPRKADILHALQEEGYRATPTHFTPQGIRTDAPIETIHTVLQDD